MEANPSEDFIIWVEESPSVAESQDNTQLEPTKRTLLKRITCFLSDIAHFNRYRRDTISTRHETDAKWRTGYPSIAEFFDKRESPAMYRRFGFLSHRLLLDKQAKLQKLQAQLENLDIVDESYHPERLMTSDLDDEEAVSRQELVSEIQRNYIEYTSLIEAARRLHKCEQPPERDYRITQHWLWNNKPLYHDDASFLDEKEDLMSVKVMPGIFSRVFASSKVTPRVFVTPGLRRNLNGKNIRYFTSLIITLIIFVLLVLPVVAVSRLTSIGVRISSFNAAGILFVFTLLFSAAISLLTKAKRHELFAASAAYCAILVVFIGNFGERIGK